MLSSVAGTVEFLSLGKPAVCGHRFIVGTEAEDEQAHFLLCVDAHRMQESVRSDPILHYLTISEVFD